MTYNFDGYNYLVRLERGEKLGECLDKFMVETKVDGGWLNGIGAASEVTIGTYHLDEKAYHWKTFSEPMEISALVGNLAKNDEGNMMFHIHGIFANEDYQTVSGHVKDITVSATLELFVHRSYQPMQRKLDESIGLQLLNLSSAG